MIGFTQIGDYLQKFQNLGEPQKALKQKFIKYAQEAAGIVLSENEIEIRGSVIYLKTDPAVKNELFYQKNKLKIFFETNPGLTEILF